MRRVWLRLACDDVRSDMALHAALRYAPHMTDPFVTPEAPSMRHDATVIHTAWRETVRTGRYAWTGAHPTHAKRIWFTLHGYGQLAERFLRHFSGCVPDDTCVVAIEGLNRFYRDMPRSDGSHVEHVGANWMTREGREHDIRDTLTWLDTVHRDVVGVWPLGGRDVAIGVLGFSQGVAMASRWVAHNRSVFHAFVAWAGGLAADVDDAALASTLEPLQVTLVAGDGDVFVTDERRLAELARLQRAQPATREVRFRGGHVLDAGALRTVLEGLPHATRPHR